MPSIYPAAPPTLTGDTVSISRFLQNPTNLQRRLRTFRDLRFVSDQLLIGRYRSQGGAVMYEMSEPVVNDRPVEAVSPGAEYPYALQPLGTAALAAVQKWGQKVPITEEQILRSAYPGSEIDKALRKTVNTIISQVDSITMSAIYSAVTAVFDVTAGGGAAWSAAGALFLRDILRAKAAITNLKLGYMPDTIAMNDVALAYLMSDEKFTNALRRETRDSPVYTGEVDVVAGLVIVSSPNITNPIVLDSQQLGGMADEGAAMPGYAVSDLAVQVKVIEKAEDAWDLQGRRKTVPVVQEPGAAVELTNTGL